MFFDEYPAFLSTSETASELDRLNLRHEAIIADNVDVLRGARVVDIASHDGRWSFAALKAGAAHVTGLEARAALAVTARRTFSKLEVSPESYDMVHGDAFETLARGELDADVVLCLGFMYHTLRYPELLQGIRATGAQHVIIDTEVLPGRTIPTIRVDVENTQDAARAAPDAFSHGGQCLIGVPSVMALEVMLGAYDYKVEKTYDWAALIAAHEGGAAKVQGYAAGRRVTIRAVDTPAPRRPGSRAPAKQSSLKKVAKAAGIKRPKAMRRN